LLATIAKMSSEEQIDCRSKAAAIKMAVATNGVERETWVRMALLWHALRRDETLASLRGAFPAAGSHKHAITIERPQLRDWELIRPHAPAC
jgi:hypothetical protein